MPKKELKSENSAGTALQEMEALAPGGDLQAYINSVHSIGVLTSEEEKNLQKIYIIEMTSMLLES